MSDPTTRGVIEGMIPDDSTLSNPGAPEGGDVQIVSSGWRLAWREFMPVKLLSSTKCPEHHPPTTQRRAPTARQFGQVQ